LELLFFCHRLGTPYALLQLWFINCHWRFGLDARFLFFWRWGSALR
jgi:hypothetical protein